MSIRQQEGTTTNNNRTTRRRSQSVFVRHEEETNAMSWNQRLKTRMRNIMVSPNGSSRRNLMLEEEEDNNMMMGSGGGSGSMKTAAAVAASAMTLTTTPYAAVPDEAGVGVSVGVLGSGTNNTRGANDVSETSMNGGFGGGVGMGGGSGDSMISPRRPTRQPGGGGSAAEGGGTGTGTTNATTTTPASKVNKQQQYTLEATRVVRYPRYQAWWKRILNFILVSSGIRYFSLLCCHRGAGATSLAQPVGVNHNKRLAVYLHWMFRVNFLFVFICMCVVFFALVILFAGFIAIAGNMDNECVLIGGIPFATQDTAFADAFALSWTTFSTVGYGSTYPALGYQNNNRTNCFFVSFICSLESLLGVLYSGFCGAILFGKVLRIQSHAQVIFSDPIVIRYGTGVTNANNTNNSHNKGAATSPDSSTTGGKGESSLIPAIPIMDGDIDFQAGSGSQQSEKQHQQQAETPSPFPVMEFRVVNRLFREVGGEIMDATLNVVANVDANDGGDPDLSTPKTVDVGNSSAGGTSRRSWHSSSSITGGGRRNNNSTNKKSAQQQRTRTGRTTSTTTSSLSSRTQRNNNMMKGNPWTTSTTTNVQQTLAQSSEVTTSQDPSESTDGGSLAEGVGGVVGYGSDLANETQRQLEQHYQMHHRRTGTIDEEEGASEAETTFHSSRGDVTTAAAAAVSNTGQQHSVHETTIAPADEDEEEEEEDDEDDAGIDSNPQSSSTNTQQHNNDDTSAAAACTTSSSSSFGQPHRRHFAAATTNNNSSNRNNINRRSTTSTTIGFGSANNTACVSFAGAGGGTNNTGAGYAPGKQVFSKMAMEATDHPFFKRVWLARHELDENSPVLKPKVRRKIRKMGGRWPQEYNTPEAIRSCLHFNQILVSLNGVSNVSASDVYAQKIYDFVDVNIGYQFVNLLYRDDIDGTLGVDIDLINDVREQDGGGGEPLFGGDDDDNNVYDDEYANEDIDNREVYYDIEQQKQHDDNDDAHRDRREQRRRRKVTV